MALLKLQEEGNSIKDQEHIHICNQISEVEDDTGASFDLMDYVLRSTGSTPAEFNSFCISDQCKKKLINEDELETSNANQICENTNDVLGNLVNSTIGNISIPLPEISMAIGEDDFGTILNNIDITVIDETLQNPKNSIFFSEVTNEVMPVVDHKVHNHRGGRPKSSTLIAEVDGIKDQSVRNRKLNNVAVARYRRNQNRKHEEMKQALINETERKAKLTVEVECLEKQVKDFRAMILHMMKKPNLVSS